MSWLRLGRVSVSVKLGKREGPDTDEEEAKRYGRLEWDVDRDKGYI
jgi:hypothetical protein